MPVIERVIIEPDGSVKKLRDLANEQMGIMLKSVMDNYPGASPKAQPKSPCAPSDDAAPAKRTSEPKTRVVANPQSRPCEIDFADLERKQQKKREGLRAVLGTKQIRFW